jgi:hypothetical protein
MAELFIDGDKIVLSLSNLEKLEALHSEIDAYVTSIKSLEVIEDAVAELPNIKSPMVLKPGHFAVGTFNSAGMKTFAVVHYDQPKGLRISLVGEEFDQWIVGCVDPGSVLANLRNDSMGQ